MSLLQPLTAADLSAQERGLHDEVLRAAGETGRDCRDVLLELCADASAGARVAEVLGGPEVVGDFYARHAEAWDVAGHAGSCDAADGDADGM